MKKILIIILTIMSLVVLFFAFGTTASAEKYKYGDLTYYVSDGEVEITYCSRNATEVVIPSEIDGYPVTKIASYAFEGCDIVSVEIPDSVITIGELSFLACEELESVKIGNGVTTIGFDAFAGLDKLTSVTIGSGLTTLGSRVFTGCDSLESITVDENNKNFSNDENGVLFNNDKTILIQYPNGKDITEYVIPDSVITIGEDAFWGCTNLENVIIGNSVTTIGEDAFWSCTNLENVTIGNSVKTISKYAFYDCDKLVSLELPDSVTTIGEKAFYGCSSIANVTIGNGLTTIDDLAFYNCDNIANITVDENNANYSCDENGVFYNKDKTILIRYPVANSCKEYSISDSVTTIAYAAFRNCGSLISLEIPASVTEVGEEAFYGCDNLADVCYAGSKSAWNSISMGSYNSNLYNASIMYNHKHSYKPIFTSSCTQTVLGMYFCECGRNYTEEVPATGHTLGEWVVKTPAKIGVKGLEVQKCTVCNAEVNKRDIPALPEETKPVEKPDTNKIVGDANGDGKITAADARITLRISAKLEKIENYNISLAVLDATGDNKLTAADARKILRVSAKLESM